MILAIPHFIFVGVLNLVALIATVIGWFAALFTGRLPVGIATFLGNITQYTARVYAYAFYLMTDRYPSFGIDEPDGFVSAQFTPTKLNRAAVFFRLILMVPGWLVSLLVQSGVQAASPVIWLIVLIVGRLPAPLFEAEAAVLRYQTRFFAFAAMLTSEQPKRLFGDRAEDAPATSVLPAQPRITRLVLSRGARTLVGLFIVLGVLLQGANAAITASSISADSALDELRAAHGRLDDGLRSYRATADGCAVSGGIDCIHSADVRLADLFVAFQRELHGIDFAAVAIEPATAVDSDITEIVTALRRRATITDPDEFRTATQDLQGLFTRFDEHYIELRRAVF